MNKPTINCVFDCDDINPALNSGWNNILKLQKTLPHITITLYIPQCWHGRFYMHDSCGYYYNSQYGNIEIGHHGFLHMNASGVGECEFIQHPKYIQEIMCNALFFSSYMNSKLIRPPGWLISHANKKLLEFNDWTIAGHTTEYINLDMLQINEPPRHPKTDNVIIHAHVDKRCGLNNIDDDNNLKNTINIINFLETHYNVKWITSKQLYSRCIRINDNTHNNNNI